MAQLQREPSASQIAVRKKILFLCGGLPFRTCFYQPHPRNILLILRNAANSNTNQLLSHSYDNEQLLFADLHGGSEEAFTHIYTKLRQPVFLYAKRFLDDVGDAEDLAADAFIKLWQRKEQFFTLDAVAAFLHVTIRNSCYNFLRHAGVKRSHEKDILHILQQEEQQEEPFLVEKVRIELISMIYAEVDKLPGRMKEIFLLSYKEGLKPAEIAERLQLQVQTVKNQRVSAIRILRDALRNYPAAVALLLVMEADAASRVLPHY